MTNVTEFLLAMPADWRAEALRALPDDTLTKLVHDGVLQAKTSCYGYCGERIRDAKAIISMIRDETINWIAGGSLRLTEEEKNGWVEPRWWTSIDFDNKPLLQVQN